jgi:hypothetical protein
LIKKIDAIDDEVSCLLLSCPDDEKPHHALKILRAFSSVELLLDFAAELSEISKEDIRAVVRLYSYLDGYCRVLLEKDGEPRRIDPDEYADRLRDVQIALHTCSKRLASP